MQENVQTAVMRDACLHMVWQLHNKIGSIHASMETSPIPWSLFVTHALQRLWHAWYCKWRVLWRIGSLLGNDSVNTLPRESTRATIGRLLLDNGSVNTPKTIRDNRRRCFPWGLSRAYIMGNFVVRSWETLTESLTTVLWGRKFVAVFTTASHRILSWASRIECNPSGLSHWGVHS
jgi:hypothetical protein